MKESWEIEFRKEIPSFLAAGYPQDIINWERIIDFIKSLDEPKLKVADSRGLVDKTIGTDIDVTTNPSESKEEND